MYFEEYLHILSLFVFSVLKGLFVFSVLKGHKITFSGKFSISQKQIQELALTHGAQLGKPFILIIVVYRNLLAYPFSRFLLKCLFVTIIFPKAIMGHGTKSRVD